jgi:hypothetical protein
MMMSYRRLQKTFFILLVLYIPFGLATSLLSYWLWKQYVLAMFLTSLWLVCMLIAGLAWLGSRCPHCSSRYMGRPVFTKRCPNCGAAVE